MKCVPPRKIAHRSRRLRRGPLVAKDRITVRFSDAESLQLQRLARQEGCTVSDLIRDAMYEQHRIGELEAQEIRH